MAKSMASHVTLLPYLLFFIPLLATPFSGAFALEVFVRNSLIYPFNCSTQINNCTASLYHIDTGLAEKEVAAYYSVNSTQIKRITHSSRKDYLVTVPCSCKSTFGTHGYFYDTLYRIQSGDIFEDVSTQIYSGQAWRDDNELKEFNPGVNITIHIPCGCSKSDSQIVVTYTIQEHDTLSEIASLLSATTKNVVTMNKNLIRNPDAIGVGWLIFVPMEKNGIKSKNTGRRKNWAIIIVILTVVSMLSIVTLLIVIFRRKKKWHENNVEDPKAMSKNLSVNKSFSLHKHFLQKENIEDVAIFESERPVIYSVEEIEEAACYFDESRKIGEGGYGSVYFGVLGQQEVAIKKMRSNKSREFFAELKVLCKIHHINVVELLGYASGDNHLFLVYEYVRNGSLSDHLYDPLLKGYQPLSWTARTQIALDAAKGIEYIHDHTKAQYVHRDIKSSNILLDEGLRAKVADFGLAKLVGRTNDEEMIATRLVGTPGYLPPESVKELQVTPKTDVFAFGVVLAELITGKRALYRDNREPTKMKSLITVVQSIFKDENTESALEVEIDGNLRGSYPMEEVFKMALISEVCLSEEAVDRPDMVEIVVILSQIVTSSVEWDASLGGNSQVFSELLNGR